MEESAPQNLSPNEDVLTPQDTLEGTTTVNVSPLGAVQGTSLENAGGVPVPAVLPTPTPSTPSTPEPPEPQSPRNLPNPLQAKLLRKVGVASAILLLFIFVLVGATVAYQKSTKPIVSQEEEIAQIKDQAVKLNNTTVGTGPESLRVGVATLFVNGDISVQGEVRVSNGDNYVQLRLADLTANQTYTLPNASGTICLDSNNCNYLNAQQLATAFSPGTGIAISGTQIANSGVLTLNGFNGAIGIQGTANQASVTAANGLITVSTPQDIATTSSPTFAGLTLSGPLSVSSGGTGVSSLTQDGVLIGNGSGPITVAASVGNGLCLLTNTGTAPSFQACPGVSPTAVSTSSDGTPNTLAKFTGSQTIADSSITDDGSTVTVNANLTANGLSSPTLQSAGSLAITASGSVTVGSTNQILTLQGNGNSTFQANSSGNVSSLGFTAPTANRTIVLPDASGTVCLQNSVSCGFASSGSGVASLDGLTGVLTVANATGSGSVLTIDDASTSQKGIAQFNSTNFSASSGTINTIQGISTAASPQFTGLTLTGNLTLGAAGIVYVNNLQNTGAGNNISINAGADNITFSNNSGANTFIFPTTGGVGQVICTTAISCAAGGGQAVLLEPGAAQTASANTDSISVNKTGGSGNLLQLQTGGTDAFVINGSGNSTIKNLTISNTLTANTITPSSSLTVGATSQQFTLQGNSSSVVTATGGGYLTSIGFVVGSGGTAPTGNITYQFRNDNTIAPGTYDVCTTSGNCGSAGSGITTSGGTPGRLAKFTASTAIDDSIISESGSTITIAGSEVIQGSSGLTVGTGAVLGVVNWQDGSSAFSATLQPTTLSANRTITIPNASGTIAVSASGPLSLNATTGALTCSTCLTTSSGVVSLDGLTGVLTLANSSGSGATVTIDNASTSQKGIAQFNSTNFSASSGTINTIQDIATSSSPTFQNLTVQGSTGLTLGSTSNLGQIRLLDGTVSGFSSTLSSATLTGNQAITIPNASGTLAVSATGNITLSSAGQIATISNPTFSSSVTTPQLTNTGSLSINPAGNLNLGSSSRVFTLVGSTISGISVYSGAFSSTLYFIPPSANRTINMPNESGTVCLQTSSSCGFLSGSGTAFIQHGNTLGEVAEVGTNDAFALDLITNNTTRLRVSSTGNVGINNTNPGNLLAVNTPTTADSTAAVLVATGGTSNKGLVIQGTAGQTADLQQWQSSTGQNLLTVSSTGESRYYSDATNYGYIGSASSGGIAIITATGGSISIQPDAALSLGTTNTGQIAIGRTGTDIPIGLRGRTTVSNVTTTNTALTVQGASGQTANLQEWQSSGGTKFLEVTSSGTVQGGSVSGTDVAGRALTLAGGRGTGSGVGGTINLQVAAPGSSGSAANNLTTVASLSGTNGAALFKNSANSTTGFQIQNAAGTSVLTVDTTNSLTTVQGASSTAVFGSELITSQAFNNATYWNCGSGWTNGASSTTHTSGGGTTNCAATSTNIAVVAGTQYLISFTVSGATGTAKVMPGIGGVSGGAMATNGTMSVILTAGSTAAFLFAPDDTFNGTISAVSIKAVTSSNSLFNTKASDGTIGLEVRNNTGSLFNLFLGVNSGKNISTGGINLGIGNAALQNNTSGGSNLAVGSNALSNNTIGNTNVAVGSYALVQNTTGSLNTAMGGGIFSSALSNNTTGSNNTAYGASSLLFNTSGSGNTALGHGTLAANISGSYNTALGYSAGSIDTDGFISGTALVNATALGYNAQVQQSASLILGGTGTDAVKIGIGTTAPENTLSVSGVQYNTGTASQSTNTVTGVGTTWTASMVGSQIIFANGAKATITGFTDATHLTVTPSQTVTSQAYRIHYNGLQVTAAGLVGINNLNPANRLNINSLATADSLAQAAIATGSATNKGVVVQGASGQSANLQEWQDSTGAILASISSAGNLTVVNATVTGTLVVTGAATFNNTLTVNGHIISGNTSGTTTVAVNTGGAGTGASASVSGNDTSGVITINTGTGAAAGTLGTVTFANAYGSAPKVIITPKAVPGGGIFPQYYFDSATTTFDLKTFNALTDSTTYTFTYQIME